MILASVAMVLVVAALVLAAAAVVLAVGLWFWWRWSLFWQQRLWFS